jgi:UDP-N-acetylglucosamine---dolichyl-phosphate N-acetylglucosaminyltransferase
MKAYAIIPARNEEKHIAEVIKGALQQLPKEQIIVVDDGSNDATGEIAEKEKVIVLRHIVNLGKGAALKTGCEYALSKGADAMIAMDSDGQHSPEDMPRLLSALKDRDIVFTYREFSRKMPFLRNAGNRFIQILSALIFGIRIKDTQCGFRAFTKEAYEKIRWQVSDYSVESEMIARAGKNHLRFAQVPIETKYLDSYKGVTAIDGIRIVMNMIWWKIAK